MHIIAGELKGRSLVFTKNPKVRPMTQLVREALFNIWRDHVADAVMLDLFCGSGSVGIEAISRGAGHVDFIDLSIREVTQNIRDLGTDANCSVFRIDALKGLERAAQNNKTYDLVFVGAPYPYEHLDLVLKSFDRLPLLRPGAILTIEHERVTALPTDFMNFSFLRTYTYGQTLITLFKANDLPKAAVESGEKPS